DEVPASLRLQVDAQALLSQVVLHEIRTAPFAKYWVEPRRVTLRCLFNLNDLGIHLGHQLGRGGTSNDLCKVQNLITCNQAPSGHASSLPGSATAAISVNVQSLYDTVRSTKDCAGFYRQAPLAASLARGNEQARLRFVHGQEEKDKEYYPVVFSPLN